MSWEESPMFKKESVKKRANKEEKRTAKQFGLKQQPNSGAGDWRKGDFVKHVPEPIRKFTHRKFVGDAKGSDKKSVSVSSKMIDKLILDMHEENGQEWFIPLIIEGELRGVVISPDLFKEITEE